MKRSLILSSLISGLWILASQSAHALIDNDTDGYSDVWEGRYGFLIGANPPANQASTADPDGDGWTNAQEALAGTNPFDATSPNGILTPAVSYTKAIVEPPPPGANIGQPETPPPTGDPNDPLGGGSSGGSTYSAPLEIRRAAHFNLSWDVVKGKAYQVHVSQDLVNWQPASGFSMGDIDPLTYQGEAIHTDNTEPPKLFYRIKIEDADSDGDTLTDYEEIILGLDPYSKDTDKDGIEDNIDPQPTVNSLTVDPDGLGLPASLENGLIGRWDLENVTSQTPASPYSTPFRFADSTAFNRPLVPFSFFVNNLGMPSKAATSTNPGFLCPPKALLGNQIHYTVSLWASLPSGSIASQQNYSVGGAKVTLFSHHKRESYYQNGVEKPERYTIKVDGIKVDGMWINRDPVTGQQTLQAGLYNYRNYNEQTGVQLGLGAIVNEFIGVSYNLPQGTFDDGKFHHYAFVLDDGNLKLFRDGALVGQKLNNPRSLIQESVQTNAGISFGRFYGVPAESGAVQYDPTAIRGSFDRIRVYSRAITTGEAESLYHQDIDHDGLWDITETKTRLWRDTNSDAVSQDSEYRFISSPFLWQSATTDTDGDGLTDLVEQSLCTDIHDTDSDDDRLDDGWELKNGLNPCSALGDDGANGRAFGWRGHGNGLAFRMRSMASCLRF